jgi:hypothetical protein
MTLGKSLLPLCVLGLLGSPLPAKDLAKINRTIAREPGYRSTPKYCLLAFGPEAKTRVWLVLDGDVLYVDRNANGDLTEAGERIIADTTGGTLDGSRHYQVPEIAEKGTPLKHALRVTLPRPAPDQACDLGLVVTLGDQRTQFSDNELRCSDRPGNAPVVHFNGPLTLRLGDDQVLARGMKPTELRVEIGTPGLGKGAFVALAHRHGESPIYVDLIKSPTREFGRVNLSGVPPQFYPVAEAEFPAKKVGAKPTKETFPLRGRC